jgi:hypothetical protein
LLKKLSCPNNQPASGKRELATWLGFEEKSGKKAKKKPSHRSNP